MAKGSLKKPGEPKCRGSRAPIEGRDWIRIGGKRWLREVAEAQGKYIPLEYRDGRNPHKDRQKAEEAVEVTKAAPPAEEVEAEVAEETVEMAPEEAVAEVAEVAAEPTAQGPTAEAVEQSEA